MAVGLAGCGREETPFAQARSDNLGRHVASRFDSGIEVLEDRDHSGLDVVHRLFESSATAVISSPQIGDQLRAASLAVFSHAPMLVMDKDNRAEVLGEITRLGAHTVVAVGKVDLADASGDFKVIKDPGTYVALGEMTAFQFDKHPVTYREQVVDAVAKLDDADPQYLYPGWAGAPATSLDDWGAAQGLGHEKTPAFPAQSKRDGGLSPVVIASRDTSVAAVASARSFGAKVRVFPVADPRFSEQTFAYVAGLADQPLVVLGTEFGNAASLREKILLGESQWERASRGDYSGLLPSQGSGTFGVTVADGQGSIVDTGIMFPQRTLIGPPPVRLDSLSDSAAIDAVLADAASRQSDYSRGHDGRSVPTVMVTVGKASPQAQDLGEDAKRDLGISAAESKLLGNLVDEAGARNIQLILGIDAAEIPTLAHTPMKQWPSILRTGLESGHVSLAFFGNDSDADSTSNAPVAAGVSRIDASEVNQVAAMLNDFAAEAKLPAKGLFLVEKRAGIIASPEIVRGDLRLVQVMVVADTRQGETPDGGQVAANATAGGGTGALGASASTAPVTAGTDAGNETDRARSLYEDVMAYDVGANLPRGYSGVNGIFSGWIRDDAGSQAKADGRQGSSMIDYAQLSPRPWLVLGP